MGYTRYWNRTEKPLTQEFLDEVNKVIVEAKDKGISVCSWDGTGVPEITIDSVSFNGTAPHMDHESFVLDENTGFNFCKTKEKPYDYVVKRVLKVAEQMGIVTDVEDDGPAEMVTDEQYLKWEEQHSY